MRLFCALTAVMGRWILPLILAGTGTVAAAEETQQTLSVTATVPESCAIATGSTGSVSCTRGTSWTSGKSSEPLPPAATATATQTVEPGTTYLTLTY